VVPGIQFNGSPGVDRTKLAEASTRPEIAYGHLSWPMPGGSTSASPVHHRAFGDLSGFTPGELVRWVWEGLELPGQPSDYHFLLQGAVDRLWSRRRDDPDGLQYVETFGYLDLVLIEAAPHVVRLDKTDPAEGVPAYRNLRPAVDPAGAGRRASRGAVPQSSCDPIR
jgi:hypothetical protein